MVIVEVDIYNRIQKWTLSLIHKQEALDLYEYVMEKRLQHFEMQAIEGLLPIKIIHAAHNVTLDIVPIYFMQVFGIGHEVEGKMSSNTSDEIQNIRNEMIRYVCEKLNWPKNE